MNQTEKFLFNQETDSPTPARGLNHADDAETTEIIEAVEAVKENDSPPSNSVAGRRNQIIGAVTVLALLVIVYFFFGRGAGEKPAADAPAAASEPEVVVSVKTAKAAREPIAEEFSAVGTIFPREQATVSAATSAQIRQMPLLKNNFVKKGDVIAVLNSQDLEAQRREAEIALREAELNRQTLVKVIAPQQNAQAEKDLADARAAVDNARAVYERRRDLYNKGGLALKDLEATKLALVNAENNLKLVQQSQTIRTTAANPNDRQIIETRVAAAQNRIQTINAQLNLATIRAPLSGVVTDQFQFAGEYAAAGARLVNIADIAEIIVKANFADTVAANLKIGDPVAVLPNDLAGERMSGKVTLVSRASDPTNRTIEVWVNLSNGAGRLRPGAAAQVVVSTNETTDAITVPASAVTLDAANADAGTVMIVGADGLAHETKVTIGVRQADKIQILAGLSGNETVIVEGN